MKFQGKTPTDQSRIARHRICAPEIMWEGMYCALNLAQRIKQCCYERVALFVDPSLTETDYGQKVVHHLQETGKLCLIWQDIRTNVPVQTVELAAAAMRGKDPELIVSIGGGCALDTAKAAVALAYGGHDMAALMAGKAITQPLPPLFAVPTTCGTGSESVPFAVVLDEVRRLKRGFAHESLVSREVFLDPIFLQSLPAPYLAATAVDSFSHSLESYVSRAATQLTRTQSVGNLLEIKQSLSGALSGDIQSGLTLLACASAGRLLYPRTGLSICHAMSHPIGAFTGAHHGACVAWTLISTTRFNIERAAQPYAQLARTLNLCESGDDHTAAESLIAWMEKWLDPLPLSDLYEEIKIAPKDVPKIAELTMESSNIPSNAARVEQADIEALLLKELDRNPNTRGAVERA